MNTQQAIEMLRSWAQNEEMVDQHFLQHGKDCNDAADVIENLVLELGEQVALHETYKTWMEND